MIWCVCLGFVCCLDLKILKELKSSGVFVLVFFCFIIKCLWNVLSEYKTFYSNCLKLCCEQFFPLCKLLTVRIESCIWFSHRSTGSLSYIIWPHCLANTHKKLHVALWHNLSKFICQIIKFTDSIIFHLDKQSNTDTEREKRIDWTERKGKTPIIIILGFFFLFSIIILCYFLIFWHFSSFFLVLPTFYASELKWQ